MDVLKFGFKYWKKNIPMSLLAKFMSMVALTCDLFLPMLTAMLIDYVVKDGDPKKNTTIFRFLLNGKYGEIHSLELFWHIALIFMLLLLVRTALIYWRNIMNQKNGLNLETTLRMVTFRKLMELDSETLSEFNTGELLTTINSDTIMFKEMFCRIIPNIFDSFYVLIVTIIILCTFNPYLLIIPVIVAPFFAVSLMKFKEQARINHRNIRASNSKMSLTVQENIEAVRLVRSFTNEEIEKDKFNLANEELKASHIKQIKLSSSFEAIFTFIKQVAYIGSLGVAAVLVMKGYLLVGSLAAITSYVLKIMDFISQLNNMMFQMQQQLVSGKKMLVFMETESKVPSGEAHVKNTEEVNLSVKNASIVLDGNTILHDINLEIPYGKKLGVVGGTGSGKSMLLESFIRVHDLTSGEIQLNGKDVRDYDLEDVRKEFAYVFQDVFLFSNTIDSNIAYSQPYVEQQQIVEAAKHAQAHSFIQQLEEGYDTIVGERGLGISGGQKQRVSIARALLRDAPVLVLDDATSALDVETEKKLLQDIKTYFPEKTLLISAHRLSSVVDCDEIIYMQDGEIIERGSFEELMKLDGHFAAVYKIQEAQYHSVVDFDHLSESEA